MTQSPRFSSGRSSSIVDSVAAPAGSMIHTVRGAASAPIIAAIDSTAVAPVRRQRLAGRRIAVVDDAGVPGARQPANDIGAHAPQTDDAELHG